MAHSLVCRDLNTSERARFDGYVKELLRLRDRAEALRSKESTSKKLQKNYARTITLYQKLRDLCGPSPDISYNMARVQDKAGQCQDAMVGYTALARGNPEESSVWASVVSRSQKRLDALSQTCAFSVDFECREDTGTTLSIDGADAVACPTSVALLVGEHELRVARPGHQAQQRVFLVEPGTTRVQVDRLKRATKGAFSLETWVSVSSGLVSGALYTKDNEAFRTPRALEGGALSLFGLTLAPEVVWWLHEKGALTARVRLDVTHLSASGVVSWRQMMWSKGVMKGWMDAGLGVGSVLLPVGRDDVIYLNRTGPVFGRVGAGVSWWESSWVKAVSGVDVLVGLPDLGIVLDVSLIGVSVNL